LKKYETIVILDEKVVNDDGTRFLNDFEKVLKEELNSSVVKSEILGRKQFAREINRRKTGVYLDIIHEMEASKVADLQEKYRLNESVLRMRTYNLDRPE